MIDYILVKYKLLSSLKYLIDLISQQNKCICFLDEVGFDQNISREYSYSLIGKPSFKSRNFGANKLNIIMIVTKNRILSYMITKNCINANIYLDFLINFAERLIENNVENIRNFAIFVDGARFHSSKLCIRLYKLFPFDIIFNSPSCPEYNMIEEVFAQIKKSVKNQAYNDMYFFIELYL